MIGKPEQADLGEVPPALLDSPPPEPFAPNLTLAQTRAFHAADDPHDLAPDLLDGATTRTVYDLGQFRRSHLAGSPATVGSPVFAAAIARETHEDNPALQIGFSYSDGFGREIQKKIQAEPAEIGGEPRWVGSGWVIFNNKGDPVRRYEPFFSQLERGHQFEFGMAVGVSPVLFYDPVGRVVATLHPNHTYEKVIFDPWHQMTFDVNDTVAPHGVEGDVGHETGDPRTDHAIGGYVAGYFASLSEADSWATWYQQRIAGAMGAPEQAAATKAATHANTPTTAYSDPLGRTFLTVAHNGYNEENDPILFSTRVRLDLEGNQREVRDSIMRDALDPGRRVARNRYDMLGGRIHQASMEAGERWLLNDVTGNPIRIWDSRGHAFRTEYDPLRRPLRSYAEGGGLAAGTLTDRLVYGEQHPEHDGRNLRGKLYAHFDQAGIVASEAYDFQGNLGRTSRRLSREYKQTIDWSSVDGDHVALPPDAAALNLTALESLISPLLEPETDSTRTEYDALNRPTTLTTADGSVIRPDYNEANLLDAVDVNLRGERQGDQPVWSPFVTNIDYDAKGQRTRIAYGNGALTTYEYDPLTFRLTGLRTTRPAAPDPVATSIFTDPGVVQDLRYTYDPVGNLTRIGDTAPRTITNANQMVEPVGNYTYDPLYRLTEASGREHISQTAFDFNPLNTRRDVPFRGLADHPNNLENLRNYTEQYAYDAVGNMQTLRHGWTRRYVYEEASLFADESNRRGNRLTRTEIGNGVSHTEQYTYQDADGVDVHGCMTGLNGLTMAWDHKDQLRQVDLGGGGTAYYVYDGGGQRVRKVIQPVAGTTRKERIYLGGFERYRESTGNGTNVTLERESLHVMDDTRRIALVETLTVENGAAIGAPAPGPRFQLDNHLGSACLELDGAGALMSYEEYHPFGTSAYQVGRGNAEVSRKRYRYTGKERDDETGPSYHGARYYAPWLGRWTSCDPLGTADGLNLFVYGRNAPTRFQDPSGTQSEDDEIARAIDNAKPIGKGLREGVATIDIDEARPISRGGSWDDPANKEFQESTTNRITKRDLINQTSRSPRPQISLAKAAAEGPEAFRKAAAEIVGRRFSEVKELETITHEARAAMQKLGRSRRELANALNAAIRRRIASGASPEAQLVQRALQESGIDPKTFKQVAKPVTIPKTVRPQTVKPPAAATPAAPRGVGGPHGQLSTPRGGGKVPGIIGAIPEIANFAEFLEATQEHETWKETLASGPVRSASRLDYEAVGGATIVGEAIGKGAVAVKDEVHERLTSDEYTLIPWESALWPF